jgi:hypothetical protein
MLTFTASVTSLNLQMSDFKKTKFYEQRMKNGLKKITESLQEDLINHENNITEFSKADIPKDEYKLIINQLENYGKLSLYLTECAVIANSKGVDKAVAFFDEFQVLLAKHDIQVQTPNFD